MEWLESYRDSLLIGLVIVNLVMLIILVTNSVRLGKLKMRMSALLGDTGGNSLEEAIVSNHEQLSELRTEQQRLNQNIDNLSRQLKQMKAKTAIMRYNAFQETGSDLSFSVAIVDESGNGLVLTGIHSRNETQIYAKPLEQGQSKYPLSPEEVEVIQQALNS